MDANTKKELLQKIDPVWSVFLEERYHLQLTKAGKDHWAVCCPFHKENTPSGHIRASNGYFDYPHYKCYGCGIFLNPIDFVMQSEGVSFLDACKILGGYVGMEISSEPKNPKHEAYKDLMTEHGRRYVRNLKSNTTAIAYTYLTKTRGITEQTLDQFMVGYVPVDEYKYRTDISGISERISFPIFEHKLPKDSKAVGMGYRTVKDLSPSWSKETDPKYKNDTTTKDDLEGVFKKDQYLYGFQHAFQSIRKNQYAIVVEGYMDVLSLHQSGITNSVGLMGTSFGEIQMDKLRALTRNIILFLDGDSAGVTHMIKYVPILLNKGFTVKIICAANGKDPADVCKEMKFDQTEMSSYIIRNAESAVNMIINHYAKDYENIVIKERNKALVNIMPIIESCSPSEKMIFTDMLLKKLDMK